MPISYRWERSCGRWNQSSANPFRTISFDEVEELNEIFAELLERNNKNKISSNRNKLQKETIEKWSNSKKIKIKYYWGCVGKSYTAHRVKCLTVAKDKELYILRAAVLCGSDVASDIDEDWHMIMKRGIYLVHDSKLNTLNKCKRCAHT
ncbi:hypothetical protein [Colwellia echini]|uniref:Uncharacterized protein n=1 Tax=Colwellia echini TaxID=1982103 RepID=A0ABY3MSM8_9GAMM|nr:hypothetical protein [Colwellia echini]TYK64201.1 hypothetical protein CWS31_016890 [Colwellia echini]